MVSWIAPVPATIQRFASNLSDALPTLTAYLLNSSATFAVPDPADSTLEAGFVLGSWTTQAGTLVIGSNLNREHMYLALAASNYDNLDRVVTIGVGAIIEEGVLHLQMDAMSSFIVVMS